jgi:hypothetical protein
MDSHTDKGMLVYYIIQPHPGGGLCDSDNGNHLRGGKSIGTGRQLGIVGNPAPKGQGSTAQGLRP